MDITCSIDISEVLGPLWTQDIDVSRRTVTLTYDEKLTVILIFNSTWTKFKCLHSHQVIDVDVDYMNGLENYYYGLYKIISCGPDIKEWIETIKDTNSGTPTRK